MGFGDAGRDRAYTDLGDQLHSDASLGVDVLEVVDELGQILDRVNVVVRRWRDEAHTGNRVARLGNRLVHLVSRQLSALAGFCALRHLDLKFIGVDQVVSRDTETSAGNLLHSAAAQIAIWIAREAVFVFAALTGVRDRKSTRLNSSHL